jgi:hypothetical protein
LIRHEVFDVKEKPLTKGKSSHSARRDLLARTKECGSGRRDTPKRPLANAGLTPETGA